MIETETIEIEDLDKRLLMEDEQELYLPEIDKENESIPTQDVDEFIEKMETRELEAREKEQGLAEKEGHEIPPGEESSLSVVMDKFGGVVEEWNQTYSGSGEMFFDAARHEIVDATGFSLTEQINTYASADQAAKHNELLSNWIEDAGQIQFIEWTEPTVTGYVLNVTAISLEAGEVISHTWSREVAFDQGDPEESEGFAELLEEPVDESTDKSRNILESAQQELVVDLNEYFATEAFAQIDAGTEKSQEEAVEITTLTEIRNPNVLLHVEQIMQAVAEEEITVPDIQEHQPAVEVASVVIGEKNIKVSYEVQSEPVVLQESVSVKFKIPVVLNSVAKTPLEGGEIAQTGIETTASAQTEVESADHRADIEPEVVNSEEFSDDISSVVHEAYIPAYETAALVEFSQNVAVDAIIDPIEIFAVESVKDSKPEIVVELEIQKIEAESGIAIKVEEFEEEVTETSIILESVSPEHMEVLTADPEFSELMMDPNRLQAAVEKLSQVSKPERVDLGQVFLRLTENAASTRYVEHMEKPLVNEKLEGIKTERKITKNESIKPAKIHTLRQNITVKEIGAEKQIVAKKQTVSPKTKRFTVQQPPAKRPNAKPVMLSRQNMVMASQRFKRVIAEADSQSEVSIESRFQTVEPKMVSLNEMAKRSFRPGASSPIANSTTQEEDELEQQVSEVKKAA